MVDAGGRGAEFRAPGRGRRPRPVRLLRGARLHADAPARRRAGGDRARLHGAPPGDDRGRDRQRAARRRDARPLSRRADRPGDRAPAAGTHAARRRRRPPARRGGEGGRQRARARSADAAPLPFPARSRSAHAPALERPLRRDDHRRGLGIQPLARPRGHALARGRHLRRLGHLRLPARCAQRRRVVGGLSTERRRAGQLRGGVLRGSRRDRPARRNDHDDARGRGLARGRRRGAPRVDLEPRQPRPRDRADVVRRGRVGAARRRRGAPGLLQAVRADGVRRRRRRAPGHAAAAVARRARGLGGAPRRRGRRDRRRRAIRDRPGALSRARARASARRSR